MLDPFSVFWINCRDLVLWFVIFHHFKVLKRQRMIVEQDFSHTFCEPTGCPVNSPRANFIGIGTWTIESKQFFKYQNRPSIIKEGHFCSNWINFARRRWQNFQVPKLLVFVFFCHSFSLSQSYKRSPAKRINIAPRSSECVEVLQNIGNH